MKKIGDIVSLESSYFEKNNKLDILYFRAKEILVEKEDDPNISKPRIIKLKEDRALDLLSNDEFPGFLFIKVSLFCVNPPPRPPLEQNTKTQEFFYIYLNKLTKFNNFCKILKN